MQPFSLTSVLKYRKQLEDKAATELLAAQTKTSSELKKLEGLQAECTQLVNRINTLQEKGIHIEELLQFEHHLSWLKEKIKIQKVSYTEAVQNEEVKRQNVLMRSQNKRVIEKLKSKQDLAYRSYLDKKESEQLDEIAILSKNRKQQGS